MPARNQRVVRGEDYRRIVREGHRVGGANCITHAVVHSEPKPARFGFIVSKSVGNAVTRNLVRRRLKAIADEAIRNGITGVDIVFRALPSSAKTPFSKLQHELARAMSKVQRLIGDHQLIDDHNPQTQSPSDLQTAAGGEHV